MNKWMGMVLVACVGLAGCAASVQRPTSVADRLDIPPVATEEIHLLVQTSPEHQRAEDWEAFRAEWRTAMASATSAAGRRFVYLDAMPAQFEGPGTLVVVNVNDYRYLSQGARLGLGVMTGNAYIDADATFYVLPQRTPVGTREYATTSTAWQGVFSAMTNKQVGAIAQEILAEIDGR